MSDSITLRTPFGDLDVAWDSACLAEIRFGAYAPNGEEIRIVSGASEREADDVVEKLMAYFRGDRDALVSLSQVPEGSGFQMEVWRATLDIPYGETRSYGDVADCLGRDRGVSRAVGTALGQNPLPLIVPCHRVVGANGDLTGFGGGLGWKRALLALEIPQFSLAL